MDTDNSPTKSNNLSSMLALFSSEHLTIEMAILYLHAHSQDTAILNILLPAFNRYSTEELADWVPIIVHIYSKSKSQLIETFLHQLALRCIPIYICIRWSLDTYVDGEDELDKLRNKLDTKFVNALSTRSIQSRDPKTLTEI